MSARQSSSTSNNNAHNKINHKQDNNSLSKLYRMYSSQKNKFKPTQQNYIQKNHAQTQPPIIELIFNHPHLLFMQSNINNNNNIEKNAITEFNIIKNIIDRKKHHKTINYNSRGTKVIDNKISPKPMTAPTNHIKRHKYSTLNISTQPQQQQQNNQINIYNFNDFQQTITPNNKKDNNACNNNTLSKTSAISYKLKPKTSSTKRLRHSGQNHHQQINSIQQQKRKSLQQRNTFDSFINEKRKTLNMKYQQNKILRDNMYHQSNNHVAQLYVNMEAKFAKFVKKHH